jgi:hypothetical protein
VVAAAAGVDRKEIFDLHVNENGNVLRVTNTNGVWSAITTCAVPIARRAHLIKLLIIRDRFIFHYDEFSSAAVCGAQILCRVKVKDELR